MSEKQPIEVQNKNIEYDNIIYCIEEEEKEAKVIGCNENQEKITIPESINIGTKEYEITSIKDNAFKNSELQFIEISTESKLKTICKHAFSFSKIKSIIIPSSVTSIGERAFYRCKQLEEIIIPSDSKLQTIEKEAFSFLQIKSITIPSSVTSIRESAFSFCNQLEEIIIPSDSKLQTIEQYALCCTKIKSITIPSELIELKERWCLNTRELIKITVNPRNPRYCFFDEKMIIGKTNIKQDNYDCLIFCVRNIKHIRIPNFIKHICSCSFEKCIQLEEIVFPNDSKLQTIGENALYSTKIKSIIIPSSITSIGEYAFASCKQLEDIIIPNDSKLQTIKKDTFYSTKIKSITIPSELTELKEGWCYGTPYLTKIAINPTNPRYLCYEDKIIIGKSNIKQDNYDCLIFCVRNIEYIEIPNFIRHICSCSFNRCNQLEGIHISPDSKLETIDDNAFSFSTIKRVTIPSSVTSIGESAFSFCIKLEEIIIPSDSKLQRIESEAFGSSTIKRIIIPSSVTSIGEDAFSFCMKLEEIIIPSNSKLQAIEKNAFGFSKIKSIIIPSSVTSIGKDAFDNCTMLQIIEINNREMISKYLDSFKICTNAILMIPVE